MTKNSLIIFYSFEGNTKFVAETMAKEIGADLLELKPKKEIGTTGFMKYFWGGKQIVHKTEPELEDYSFDPDKYDLIIIGTPVWAFTFTPPIRTFFKQNKFQNKKVAIFCTHEGRFGKTFENMRKELEGNEIIAELDLKNVKKERKESEVRAREWIGSLLVS